MTGLSLATRVMATLSAAAILTLALAAAHVADGSNAPHYRDSERAAKQNMVLGTIVPAHSAAPLDWFSPRLRSAVCGRYSEWIRPLACADKLLTLNDAVLSANAALRLLGPPTSGQINHRLQSTYAVDGMRLAALLQDGKVSALTAARDLLAMARSADRNSLPFAQVTWRELEPSTRSQHTKFPAGSFARIEESVSARPNPWAAFSGCVYTRASAPPVRHPELLGHPGAPAHCLLKPGNDVAVARVPAPPGWADIAPQLVGAAQSAHGSPANPNMITVFDRPVQQGYHAISTILRREQEVTQGVADCLTAKDAACKALGIDSSIWATRYESAAVRRIGLLIVDLSTGQIEAAGSAHTGCYEQQHDGPGRSADCPQLPAPPVRRAELLSNHALFGQAMPGSLIKPVTALALLADPTYGPYLLGGGRERLKRDIAESNSKAFHDRVFCAEKRFSECARPGYFADAAKRVGWNLGCIESEAANCGSASLVTGKPAGRLVTFTARAGIRQQAGREGAWEAVPATFSRDWAETCAKGSWSKCKGGTGSAVDLLAEFWGQGNSRASPLGIAAMLATLGAAANREQVTASPHLLHSTMPASDILVGTQSRLSIDPVHADLILSGMRLGHHTGGTSASACAAVATLKRCNAIDWVAGKTATPVFNHDRMTLANRARVCGDALQRRPRSRSEQELAFHCGASPFKWYAALVKTDQASSARWNKIVVVLAERNWDRVTGLVDSPGDVGVNIAARAAFETILRLY